MCRRVLLQHSLVANTSFLLRNTTYITDQRNLAALTSICRGDELSARIPHAQLHPRGAARMLQVEVLQGHGNSGEALPPRVARQVQHQAHPHRRRRRRCHRTAPKHEQREETCRSSDGEQAPSWPPLHPTEYPLGGGVYIYLLSWCTRYITYMYCTAIERAA